MKDLFDDGKSLLDAGALGGDGGRRSFLKVAAGAGFATAALPVVAETVIKTPDAGLDAGMHQVVIDGDNVPVYCAQPAGKKNAPVVLVISEIFGLHEHIQDVARRFAHEGYMAIAPDLFVRQGDPTKVANIADLMKTIIAKTPDQQVLRDLDLIVAWARQRGGNIDRLGITGFCWGGRITWLYCAHNPKVKAGVAWYGRLIGEPSTNNPRQPVDVAPKLTVPVLGLYGGRDTGISLASVELMREALAKGSSGSTIHVYPESGHAFHADYRPSYNAVDARDGFKRALGWLRQHGA